MATAVQKIILSSSRDIPFNKLVLSQSNVRRVKAGISIEDLAASIARRGLIQSLSVVPVVDAEGQETGMFEVPAGGRRFRALELLVKQKRLAKIAPVPCVVRKRDDEVLSEEVSLVENIDRAPLHPLDQFRAFQDMRVKGKTEEEIAAALFVPVQVVKPDAGDQAEPCQHLTRQPRHTRRLGPQPHWRGTGGFAGQGLRIVVRGIPTPGRALAHEVGLPSVRVMRTRRCRSPEPNLSSAAAKSRSTIM